MGCCSSLLLLTPIVIKQSGIYLVGILASLIFVFHSAERLEKGVRARAEFLQTGFRLCQVVARSVGYLVWAAYADLNEIPKSFGLRPSEEWNLMSSIEFCLQHSFSLMVVHMLQLRHSFY